MSGTPINLNKARKARARADQKARADQNAVAFGRSKADKIADGLDAVRSARLLDGATLKTHTKGPESGEKKP